MFFKPQHNLRDSMKRITSMICIGLTASLLSACHENPLKTHSTKKNVDFLMDASKAAKDNLKLFGKGYKASTIYQTCVEDGRHIDVNCIAFFDAMVAFAKTQPPSRFTDITRADLRDKAAFARLVDEYELTDSMTSTSRDER